VILKIVNAALKIKGKAKFITFGLKARLEATADLEGYTSACSTCSTVSLE